MNPRLGAARSPSCLSDFVLDQVMAAELTGAALQAARQHLAQCRRCAERLADFESIQVPPLNPGAGTRPEHAGRAGARRWAPLLGAAAAVVAAALVLRGPSRESGDGSADGDGVRTKGELALGVIVRRASGAVVRLAPGEAVMPGDALRFEVARGRPGFVAVLGLDAAGVVTAYAPVSGPLPKLASGPGVVLDGSIVADDTLGPERIVALLCSQPIPLTELTQAAERALASAGGDPRRVETLGTACAEAKFDIDKRPTP